MPKGYPKKKEIDHAHEAVVKQAAVAEDPVNTQELLDEIAQLKREKADLMKTQVDAEPADALAYLKVIAAGMSPVSSTPGVKKVPQGYGQPYTLTEQRKEQIIEIFKKFEGKGVEFKFNDVDGSVTFRKKIKVRVYDQENEMWTREEAWKAETVHCSSSDNTIGKLVKFILLV